MASKDKVFMGIRGRVPSKAGRSVGSPPELGRVSRMGRFYHNNKELGGRRKSGRFRTGKIPLYVKILSLVVLSLAVFIPLGLWIQGRSEIDDDINDAKPKTQEVVRVASRFPAPREEEATRLVKQALAARNVPDLKKSIRMGETSAKEILEFLSTMEEKEGKAEQFDWMAGMDANGLQIEGVLVRFGEKNNRLAMLTPDETGTWHLDFDSFARQVRPGWKQIFSTPATEAQVRVYVGRDAYYNGAFSDESRWICYALASPDNDTLMMGYVKPGSSQHIAMESVLGGKTINRAVLKISRDATMEPRQFVIRDVIAEDWVVGDSVYDQRFTPNPGMLSEPGQAGGR
jgi:hypothetical protein